MGKFTSAETTAKNKARIWTSEMRAKVSASVRRHYEAHSDSPETREKKGASGRGKHLSVEHRKKIGDGNRGQPKPAGMMKRLQASNVGRVPSLEARAKMSAARKGKRCGAADWWLDPKNAARGRKAWAVSNNLKPNKLEQVFGKLLEDLFPGEYRYVGDFSFILGGKCPDFANVNGQKKLIEVFGDYWHRGQDPAWRIALFARLGFQTLVVWESELAQEPEAVVARLQEFHEMGSKKGSRKGK